MAVSQDWTTLVNSLPKESAALSLDDITFPEVGNYADPEAKEMSRFLFRLNKNTAAIKETRPTIIKKFNEWYPTVSKTPDARKVSNFIEYLNTNIQGTHKASIMTAVTKVEKELAKGGFRDENPISGPTVARQSRKRANPRLDESSGSENENSENGEGARQRIPNRRRKRAGLDSAAMKSLMNKPAPATSEARAEPTTEEEKAAVKIQAFYRGHRGRELVENMRAEKTRKESEEEKAAVTIQTAFRGYSARKLLAKEKEDKDKVDALKSKLEDETGYESKAQAAAIKIQAAYRGYLRKKRQRDVIGAKKALEERLPETPEPSDSDIDDARGDFVRAAATTPYTPGDYNATEGFINRVDRRNELRPFGGKESTQIKYNPALYFNGDGNDNGKRHPHDFLKMDSRGKIKAVYDQTKSWSELWYKLSTSFMTISLQDQRFSDKKYDGYHQFIDFHGKRYIDRSRDVEGEHDPNKTPEDRQREFIFTIAGRFGKGRDVVKVIGNEAVNEIEDIVNHEIDIHRFYNTEEQEFLKTLPDKILKYFQEEEGAKKDNSIRHITHILGASIAAASKITNKSTPEKKAEALQEIKEALEGLTLEKQPQQQELVAEIRYGGHVAYAAKKMSPGVLVGIDNATIEGLENQERREELAKYANYHSVAQLAVQYYRLKAEETPSPENVDKLKACKHFVDILQRYGIETQADGAAKSQEEIQAAIVASPPEKQEQIREAVRREFIYGQDLAPHQELAAQLDKTSLRLVVNLAHQYNSAASNKKRQSPISDYKVFADILKHRGVETKVEKDGTVEQIPPNDIFDSITSTETSRLIMDRAQLELKRLQDLDPHQELKAKLDAATRGEERMDLIANFERHNNRKVSNEAVHQITVKQENLRVNLTDDIEAVQSAIQSAVYQRWSTAGVGSKEVFSDAGLDRFPIITGTGIATSTMSTGSPGKHKHTKIIRISFNAREGEKLPVEHQTQEIALPYCGLKVRARLVKQGDTASRYKNGKEELYTNDTDGDQIIYDENTVWGYIRDSRSSDPRVRKYAPINATKQALGVHYDDPGYLLNRFKDTGIEAIYREGNSIISAACKVAGSAKVVEISGHEIAKDMVEKLNKKVAESLAAKTSPDITPAQLAELLEKREKYLDLALRGGYRNSRTLNNSLFKSVPEYQKHTLSNLSFDRTPGKGDRIWKHGPGGNISKLATTLDNEALIDLGKHSKLGDKLQLNEFRRRVVAYTIEAAQQKQLGTSHWYTRGKQGFITEAFQAVEEELNKRGMVTGKDREDFLQGLSQDMGKYASVKDNKHVRSWYWPPSYKSFQGYSAAEKRVQAAKTEHEETTHLDSTTKLSQAIATPGNANDVDLKKAKEQIASEATKATNRFKKNNDKGTFANLIDREYSVDQEHTVRPIADELTQLNRRIVAEKRKPSTDGSVANLFRLRETQLDLLLKSGASTENYTHSFHKDPQTKEFTNSLLNDLGYEDRVLVTLHEYNNKELIATSIAGFAKDIEIRREAEKAQPTVFSTELAGLQDEIDISQFRRRAAAAIVEKGNTWYTKGNPENRILDGMESAYHNIDKLSKNTSPPTLNNEDSAKFFKELTQDMLDFANGNDLNMASSQTIQNAAMKFCSDLTIPVEIRNLAAEFQAMKPTTKPSSLEQPTVGLVFKDDRKPAIQKLAEIFDTQISKDVAPYGPDTRLDIEEFSRNVAKFAVENANKKYQGSSKASALAEVFKYVNEELNERGLLLDDTSRKSFNEALKNNMRSYAGRTGRGHVQRQVNTAKTQYEEKEGLYNEKERFCIEIMQTASDDLPKNWHTQLKALPAESLEKVIKGYVAAQKAKGENLHINPTIKQQEPTTDLTNAKETLEAIAQEVFGVQGSPDAPKLGTTTRDTPVDYMKMLQFSYEAAKYTAHCGKEFKRHEDYTRDSRITKFVRGELSEGRKDFVEVMIGTAAEKVVMASQNDSLEGRAKYTIEKDLGEYAAKQAISTKMGVGYTKMAQDYLRQPGANPSLVTEDGPSLVTEDGATHEYFGTGGRNKFRAVAKKVLEESKEEWAKSQ